jgi:hypothetical protein
MRERALAEERGVLALPGLDIALPYLAGNVKAEHGHLEKFVKMLVDLIQIIERVKSKREQPVAK